MRSDEAGVVSVSIFLVQGSDEVDNDGMWSANGSAGWTVPLTLAHVARIRVLDLEGYGLNSMGGSQGDEIAGSVSASMATRSRRPVGI